MGKTHLSVRVLLPPAFVPERDQNGMPGGRPKGDDAGQENV